MPRSRERALYALAAVLGATVLALGVLYFTAAPEIPERPVTRFSFSPEGVQGAAISPNGNHILYTAGVGDAATLWVRSLANESVRELAGTEGVHEAFWSPDSLTIGFGTSIELKRVALSGGNVVTLCELPSGRFSSGQFAFLGGSWSPDGRRIVFSAGLLLYEIAALGGDPKLLLEREELGRRYHFSPRFLPSTGGT